MAGRAVLLATVGALVVLAGCQGPAFDRQTVTPGAVPSDSGSVTTDSDRLVEDHQRALRNRSHTTTVEVAIEYENGSVARRTDRFAVARDDSYLYERGTVGPYPESVDNLTIWQNSSYESRRENGTVTVQRSAGVADTALSEYIGRLLEPFELAAESTGTGYRLSASAERAQAVPLPTPLVDHRNATAEVEVREDVLRTITIELQADRFDRGETVTARITVTVTDVGETDPRRPAWAEGGA